MSDSPLRLEGVSQSFGELEVLRDFWLDVAHDEFVAVVGPSGCGKTTLLNLLSGRYRTTGGRLVRHGRFRVVYQQDGLFPWMTVGQNIGLGLGEVADPAAKERQLRELISLVHLEGFGEHYPHQLSGGMRQRVELAR